MSTAQKISISLDPDELAWIQKRARRRRASVSAVIGEAVAVLRKREARAKLLVLLGDAADATAEELAAIEAEWKG